LCDPAIFQDHEQLVILQKELESYKEEQEVLMTEWMELEEELEQL
jgi:ATP-binding cassette subfamily F protein 3